jgi:multiple sugar transport system permease protein
MNNKNESKHQIEIDKKKQEKLDKLEKQLDNLFYLLKQVENEKEKQKILEHINKTQKKIKHIKIGGLISRETKRSLVAYSFIAPNFIGFMVFTLGPILFAFVLAFMKWDGNNPMEFVGFDNFTKLPTDTRFVASLINTVVYSVATVPLTLLCALGLAVILNQKVKFRNVFRTASFFPYVASLVAVAAVWNMLFSPANGPMNMLLVKLGVAVKDLPKWAADKDFAMLTVVLFSVWKSMGYYMVIYLAGLQGISSEMYEAASLDGANAWQKFRSITWPMLQPTTFFVVVIMTINCFKVYDQIYMITQGGPGTSTLVLVYHIYNTAFGSWDLGYASAISVVLFLLVLLVTLIQFRGEKKYANS